MSKINEMREDMRLAYLNDGSYSLLFMFVRFLKGLMTVAALGCFAVGIWYLTYGYGEGFASDSFMDREPPVAATIPAPDDQLTADRVAMLREFAKMNRHHLDISSGETPSGVSATEVFANTESTATEDAAIAAEIADSVSTRGTRALNERVRTLFDDIEQKLGKTSDADTQPPLVLTSQSQPVPASSALEQLLPNTTTATDGGEKAESQAQDNRVKDSDWLLSQNPERFLIQIGSTPNEPFLVRFEQQLPDKQPSAIFEMLIGERPEHVLTYGLFDSRDSANAALGNLSQVARKYGAYVRPIARVQQQVRDLGSS